MQKYAWRPHSTHEPIRTLWEHEQSVNFLKTRFLDIINRYKIGKFTGTENFQSVIVHRHSDIVSGHSIFPMCDCIDDTLKPSKLRIFRLSFEKSGFGIKCRNSRSWIDRNFFAFSINLGSGSSIFASLIMFIRVPTSAAILSTVWSEYGN